MGADWRKAREVLCCWGGGRTSSILWKWVWAGGWDCITLLPPQGVSGTGLFDKVCGIVSGQLPWSPSSFLTFWLPVWPGSVPGEARFSASPEAMQLCNKEEAILAANVTQLAGPASRGTVTPSWAWVPPWLVKQPSSWRKKKPIHTICGAWLWSSRSLALTQHMPGSPQKRWSTPTTELPLPADQFSSLFQPVDSPLTSTGILEF